VDAQELLDRLQSRKKAILMSLTPNLQTEYEELKTVIRHVKAVIDSVQSANGASSLDAGVHVAEDEAKEEACQFEADVASPHS